MIRSLKKQLAVNTLVNYAHLLIHIICSMYLTRLIYLNMDKESYGFWQLLWVIFGYSLLLDFGFGITVQKYSAEYTVTKDAKSLSETLSIVLCSYLLMSLIIALACIGTTPYINTLFVFETSVSQDKMEQFKTAFLIFGIGTAIIFPSGVFAEILHGLGRLDIKNYIRIGERLLYTAGVVAVFKLEWSLIELTILSILVNILLNLFMALMVFRKVPDLKINIFKFRLSKIKSIGSFSLFAYLVILSNLVIFKTDHFVLGLSLGMTAIAIYHIGSRLANLLTNFATRFQENLAPVAAVLYHKGDMNKLRRLLLNSNRTSVFITTGFFIVFIMLLKPILYFWLKVTDQDTGAYEIAIIMLFSVFVQAAIRSASDKFLFMAGKHKAMAYISMAEAGLNLTLSVIFIQIWGVTGVAWGTLIPNLFISIFIFYPMMCSFGQFKKATFFRKVFWPTLLSALPCLFVLSIITHYIFPAELLHLWEGWPGFFRLAGCTILTALLYVTSGFYLLFKTHQRQEILDSIVKVFRKKENTHG